MKGMVSMKNLIIVGLLTGRCSSKKVLIIGPPGSGKTYLSKRFWELGLNSVDADSVEGLSKWIDRRGNETTYRSNGGGEWLKTHEFVWDRKVLIDYLRKSRELYLFGVSDNIYEMIDLFDAVYYLDLVPAELEKRLTNQERRNPVGRTEEERRVVMREAERLREKARDLGVEYVDASLTPDEVLKRIRS